MYHSAYIDGQENAEELSPGDTVRILNERTGNPSGWTGTVTYIDETAGFVEIEVPFANTLRYRAEVVIPAEDPDDLILDQGNGEVQEEEQYTEPGDQVEARVSERYATSVLPPLISAAKACHTRGFGDVEAYQKLSNRYTRTHSDCEIRNAVRSVYEESFKDDVAKKVSKLAVQDPTINDLAVDLLSNLS